MSLLDLAYLFIIYSFIGWAVETITVSYNRRYLANTGFLDGPFSPIYGFGALAIMFMIYQFKPSLLNLFIFSIIISTVFEYLVSLFFDKFFHVVWWNYSQEPFNLHGRICLKTSLFWGFLAVLFFIFFHQKIFILANFFSHFLGVNGLIAFATYFVIDATDCFKSFLKNKQHFDCQFDKHFKRLLRSYPNFISKF